MDWSNTKVLVLGAQRTGTGVARFLRARGIAVRVADRAAEAREQLASETGIETCADDVDALRGIDLVVPSPGVARTHPVLRKAVENRIHVWSEIELASRFLTCPVLAVTGTNGKSTTTTLLGEMASAAGVRAFVGGNLGTPLIDAVCAETMPELAVVEVSSFQLEWVHSFRPALSVVLNLTPDHLDRYASLHEYAEAKACLVTRLHPDDWAVLNRDDDWVWGLRERTYAKVVSFGRDPVEFGSYLAAGSIVHHGGEAAPRRFSLERTQLRGKHNEENLMAAVSAACTWGLPERAIQCAIDTLRPLPHRAARVGERNGVQFIDDSKGTNVGAVAKTLSSFSGQVVLLLGGFDKGGDFRQLAGEIRRHVRHIVAFGAAADLIADQLRGLVSISTASRLGAAVEKAARVAQPGDTVLLSPGCASFDEFRDYAERGDRFRALVEALP